MTMRETAEMIIGPLMEMPPEQWDEMLDGQIEGELDDFTKQVRGDD